jgi:hypothetical protein
VRSLVTIAGPRLRCRSVGSDGRACTRDRDQADGHVATVGTSEFGSWNSTANSEFQIPSPESVAVQ